MFLKHLISTKQFSSEMLLAVFNLAEELRNKYERGESLDLLQGKILATLFFEPSTRTRFSFETAMLRLGGKVVANADMFNTSSTVKNETLFDSGRVVSQMVDVIAMRHPEAGSVEEFARGSTVPVINAGDGSNEHPTQAILDLYTIWREFGDLNGLKIALVGDLKYGRVPHSQVDLLKHFSCSYFFVSPKALAMPEKILEELRLLGGEFVECEDLREVLALVDVIAMTRVQKERFKDLAEYAKYAGAYVLDRRLLSLAKKDAIVLHPLPRVEEIALDLDEDPRVRYFEQVRNGVFVRMALYLKLLNQGF